MTEFENNPKGGCLLIDQKETCELREKRIKSKNLYDIDYYGWVENQVSFLKEGKLEMLDIENLIEEIISLGNSEWSKLESYLMSALRENGLI